MRTFWLAAALTLGLASAAPAQEGGAHRMVIEAQIAAFLADDFAAAFDFASPNIQAIFGTPERFGQMVTQGYPMVHRPSEVRFLDQAERGGAIYQRVLIADAAGRLHVLEYEMIPGPTGFLINGVRIVPGGAAGV
jgi:hypothetical protein